MKRNVQMLAPTSILILIVVNACITKTTNPVPATTQSSPSPAASQQPKATSNDSPRSQLTLAVLDALLAREEFVSELKAKLQVSDDQVQALKNAASTEVSRLRTTNAEQTVANSAEERSRASEQIARVIGTEKATQLDTLASEFWAKGGDTDVSTDKQAAPTLPTTPNSVPADTRIVVNIPAYRMDLFKDGSLIKSYKIGIGYPEFPLPQGLRKAQTIIFNPTWTPPDSPWVATMKNVTPGEKIEAGSKLNPLGPIK